MSCFDDPFSAYNNMPARRAGSDGAADSKPLPFTPAKMSAEEWLKTDAVFQMRWRNSHPDSNMSTEQQLAATCEAYAAYREGRE